MAHCPLFRFPILHVNSKKYGTEDTIMPTICCSRPSSSSQYDMLVMLEIEVYPKESLLLEPPTFEASVISQKLMTVTFGSVLTVNELVILDYAGEALVCRVARVRVDEETQSTAAGAAMEEAHRGTIGVQSRFYVVPSNDEVIAIQGSQPLPDEIPANVIHVTTSDGEWFPVKRELLAPCLSLTKYVQAGRGKYKDVEISIPREERSPDAPEDDESSTCPHCKIEVDCCTFDRVLLFILSLLYPTEKTFTPGISELNTLIDAGEKLGLQPLVDVCEEKNAAFDSRVRKDRFIPLAEVEHRNNSESELLILMDGMVFDITRWIDEHPGGASIIPTQALNIDCTVFFEMYHVSRQSFLYLKQFYIGELSPQDRAVLKEQSTNGVLASTAFLQSLRQYTSPWRVTTISEDSVANEAHKSF
jgi:hypothetical protein